MKPAVAFEDIEAAAVRLSGQVLDTPCVESKTLGQIVGAQVFLKFENLQFTASFKERGALNKLATLIESGAPIKGVIAASAGNHAQGVAHHAQRLGLRAVIVMPLNTPTVKVERTRGFRAEVVLHGESFDEARDKALQMADQQGLTFVHPFDDAAVIAGQGTIGIEMLKAQPDLDTLIIAIGGGGLISGIATAVQRLKPGIEIIGVQAARFPAMVNAIKGTAHPQGASTIAEGIAVGQPGRITREIVRALVDDIVLVDEGDIEQAVANWNGARAASGTPVKLGDLTRQVRLDDVDGIGNDLYVDTLALSTVAKAAPALTVDDVWPLLQPLRVEHLRLVGATASPAIGGAAAAKTIGQVRDASPTLPEAQPLQGLLWGDIIGSTKTKPLPSAAGITIASVLGNFRGVTLGEFLRAAQPISDQDPSALDLGAVNLADYSTGTGTQMSVGFRLDGTTRPDGVRLVTTLPADSRYVDGSAQLQGGPSPVGLEPTTFGDTLVWLVTNVQPAVDYTIRFGVRAPAQTGTVTASVSGQLQRRNVFASASTVIDYREAFEPNDRPADPAIQTIGPDQIFLSQISTATDVDLYRFEVTTSGTRIGAVLSNLPADYDLTIVGPSEPSAATTGGRVLESVGDSQLGVTGGKTAATLADAGQYQPPAGSNLGVIARSTGRGTATERIDQIPVTRLGTYYLVVTGYDGVSSGKSYALQLQSDAPTLLPAVCPPNGRWYMVPSGLRSNGMPMCSRSYTTLGASRHINSIASWSPR